jgi:DNA (cytosine-5)-methyltransferase 1
MFSRLVNIVRATGREPKFGDLHPEFVRVVEEAQPKWWLCENVPAAPTPDVWGYAAEMFYCSPRWLGDSQSRKRKFTFGSHEGEFREAGIAKRIAWATLESPDYEYACTGGGRERPVKIGGSGKVKVGRKTLSAEERKRRHGGALSTNKKTAAADLARGQGFPGLDSELVAFTRAAACQALGNGVPRVMGEAIAKAINEWWDNAARSEPTTPSTGGRSR